MSRAPGLGWQRRSAAHCPGFAQARPWQPPPRHQPPASNVNPHPARRRCACPAARSTPTIIDNQAVAVLIFKKAPPEAVQGVLETVAAKLEGEEAALQGGAA